MSHASLTITDDELPLKMEVAFSGDNNEYDPNLVPHALIAYCWNLVRESSDALENADKPRILLPGGGI